MARKGRRGLWLVAAVVLLALAAWLMSRGDRELPTGPVERVEFPRELRGPESERMRKRRTQQVVVPARPGEPEQQRMVMRDPVLAALPRGKNQTAVVVEANAIRNSPLGEMLLECLNADGARGLEDFRRETGIDPLQDLDRVMMWEGNVVLSGHFENAQWAKLMETADRQYYGENTTIFTPPSRDDGERIPSFGSWNDQLIVVGDDPNAVKDVIDRIEGRSNEQGEVLLDESQTYGEIYGVISAEDLARMLPPEQAMLADKLRAAAQQIELHVDTRNGVAISADVTGPDGEQVTDLGKALGGALSLARLKAQAEGADELAELLDYARVSPDGESFAVEMAMPVEVLKERLAFCKERQPAKAQVQGELQ